MKLKIFTLFTIILFACNANIESNKIANTLVDSNELIIPADTMKTNTNYDSISVENNFVNEVFGKNDFMLYFNKMSNAVTKQTIELKPNEYDETIVDTVKTLYWGKSYIITVNNNSINGVSINAAFINDNTISISNNIKIGNSLKQVCDTYKIKCDPSKSYKFVELYFGDATSYLTLF